MGNCCGSPPSKTIGNGHTSDEPTVGKKSSPTDMQHATKGNGQDERYTLEPSDKLRLQIEQLQRKGRKVVKAIYPYQAPSNSTEASSDLDLKVNDVFEILNDEFEWWLARNIATDRQGYIPSTYVVLVDSIDQNEWYHGNIDRKEAEKRLMAPGHISGTFLVRLSKPADASAKIGYAVSVLDIEQPEPSHGRRTSVSKGAAVNAVVKNIRHYRVRCLDDGRCMFSPKVIRPSLQDLIALHTANPDGLNNNANMAPILVRPCPKGKPVIFDMTRNTTDRWQIDRNVLKFDKRLGSGAFGEVYKGQWRGHDVAIKSLTPGRMDAETFLAEATVMKRLKHTHLVCLYAVCLDAEPFYIVTEYMVNGDLLTFLRKSRDAQNADFRLNNKQLIDIAIQVAHGMAYIHLKGIIHRDLAARNVLVGENNSVKIGDFGLARSADSSKNETDSTKLPIKWTSPEAITECRFSFKSDVWSFGILLVELFTLGDMPYNGMKSRELLEKLSAGYRHPRPVGCPPEVYDTMLYCWKRLPEERPTFEHLEDRLINLDEIGKDYQEM